MRRWIAAALFELGLAVLCLAGAGYSWSHARRTTEYVTADDHPAFEAVRYVPPLLILATGLVILAGVLVIDAVARIVTGYVAPRVTETMH
ncbi:hypothetical protein ACFU44_26325 [Nocardia rhizosphaerihabitans]|uniref:hypothetical protein n=1 Tax=Nocardia rhizosphaerihabitans TaxID=1691570 RepID=UPI00366BF1F1